MVSGIKDLAFDEFKISLRDGEEVEVYTDGSCIGNPGPGGWGIVFVSHEKRSSISGYEKATTNNRMELMAANMALRSLPDNVKIFLYTDSMYVKNGITIWIQKWLKNNWLSSSGGAVKNKDLWIELYNATLNKNIKWFWVKGHADCSDNNNADFLARSAIVSSYMTDA
ncbi:MAG: ribonuclease HI [Holosporales bacterium]|jgi:ribonuclease HI|nr:ribonuclease HI [Holosporales bacterium]